MACSDENPPYPLPEEAQFFLTSDSAKTWKLAQRFNNKTRMNMGDCFLSYRVTYSSTMVMQDNSGEHSDCGETLRATWQFTRNTKGNHYIRLTSKQLPELLHINKEYKPFKILYLSTDQLTLQYSHTQFSTKRTIITDIYVPELLEINDHDFHW